MSQRIESTRRDARGARNSKASSGRNRELNCQIRLAGPAVSFHQIASPSARRESEQRMFRMTGAVNPRCPPDIRRNVENGALAVGLEHARTGVNACRKLNITDSSP